MKGKHFRHTSDFCTIVNGQLGEKLLVSLSKVQAANLD